MGTTQAKARAAAAAALGDSDSDSDRAKEKEKEPVQKEKGKEKAEGGGGGFGLSSDPVVDALLGLGPTPAAKKIADPFEVNARHTAHIYMQTERQRERGLTAALE